MSDPNPANGDPRTEGDGPTPRPSSTVPLLISFEARYGSVWIDPLAVGTVEGSACNDSGTRLVTTSGGNYELTAAPDRVAKIVNDARTAIAQARRDAR